MQKLLAFCFLASFAVQGILTAVPSKNVSVSRTKSGQIFAPGDLMFEDNFDTLDLNKWHHEVNMWGGGNGEFQIYDKNPENSFVRDGTLFIKPTLALDTFGGDYEMQYNGQLDLVGCTHEDGGDACSRKAWYPNILPPAYSARLRTLDSFDFTYGKVEVRAKMPAGDWQWPAIWLLPSDQVYGGWPFSGEMDLVESRGNRKLFDADTGENIGSEHIGSTLHFGPGWPYNGYWAATASRNSPPDQGYDRDFHLYEVEWTPEFIRFTVDGEELNYINPPAGGFFELGDFPADVPNPWLGAPNFHMAPFDQDFHLVINVAVGGAFFPDYATGPYPRPWIPSSPITFLEYFWFRDYWLPSWQGDDGAMQIDYVRVYAV